MCTGGSCLAQRFGRESPHTSGLNVTRDHILGQPERDWRIEECTTVHSVMLSADPSLISPALCALCWAARERRSARSAGVERATKIVQGMAQTVGRL